MDSVIIIGLRRSILGEVVRIGVEVDGEGKTRDDGLDGKIMIADWTIREGQKKSSGRATSFWGNRNRV